MRKIFMCIMILSMPLLSMAQEDSSLSSGIKWTTGLSWEQVKQEAKIENKYIFLDCFATWCGPCKQMEKYVFVDKHLGKYYNEKFISIRVQIDRTKNDDVFVKSWYKDAESINKNYKITAFPTFLYFKPDGSIVYKERGYQGSFKMVDIAKLATIHGRKYEDPYEKYDEFVAEYNKGSRDYKKMPSMIEKAKEIGDRTIATTLSKEYFDYLSHSKKSEWYTKTNIKFIATNISSSQSSFFKMFYPDGTRVNKIMGKKQFSRYTIDKVISEEMTKPFLDSLFRHHTKKMLLAGIEPVWDSMANVIANKYDGEYANRAIRGVKYKFYFAIMQQVSPSYRSLFVKNMSEMLDNDDMDPDDEYTDIGINQAAWEVFAHSNDKEEISLAIRWMKSLITRYNSYDKKGTQFFTWDTYANLLYKSYLLYHNIKLNDALSWEKKALQQAIAKDALQVIIDDCRQKIDKMSRDVPTWN